MKLEEIEVTAEEVYGVEFKPQPYKSYKCGQACLAMITGLSIEQICNELNKEYSTNIISDLKKLLDTKGYKTFVVYGEFETCEVPNNSIIRFEKPCKGGHFILKVDGKLLDPEIGEVKKYMNHYKVIQYLNFKKKNKL